MNILVYNGAGSSPESVRHTIETFRTLLEPYYAVSPVSARTLETEPWTSKTSAVVFPGGADLSYVRDCAKVIPKIRDFVYKDGGLFKVLQGQNGDNLALFMHVLPNWLIIL